MLMKSSGARLGGWCNEGGGMRIALETDDLLILFLTRDKEPGSLFALNYPMGIWQVG